MATVEPSSDDPPLYTALLAELLARDEPPARRHRGDGYGPAGGGGHRWRDDDTGEVVVGRHGDDDGDGVINRSDPDSPEYEGAPVERNEMGGPLLARSMVAAGAGRGLDGSVIRAALAAVGAVGKQVRSLDELATGARTALAQAPRGLTAQGAASFLATCAQESAYFRTTREYGSGQWYAPWIGRGFVQVTHESNYRKFGAWCRTHGLVTDPDVFVKNRAALEDYRYAWLTAVWYFEANRLWPYANRGDHRAVSQGVNGGPGRIGTGFTPHGWSERQAMYAAFLRAGDSLLPVAAAPPAPPRPRKVLDMPERAFGPGDSGHRIVAPTGSASGIVAKSWLSASVDGSALIEVWAQRAGDSAPVGAGKDDVAHRVWNLGPGHRPWLELPSGTEFVTVHVKHSTGPGSLLVEQAPK